MNWQMNATTEEARFSLIEQLRKITGDFVFITPVRDYFQLSMVYDHLLTIEVDPEELSRDVVVYFWEVISGSINSELNSFTDNRVDLTELIRAERLCAEAVLESRVFQNYIDSTGGRFDFNVVGPATCEG